jgi:hypothetical protein
LPLEVTTDADAEAGEVWVPVVQTCVDDTVMRWVHEGVETDDGFAAVLAHVDPDAGLTAAQIADRDRDRTPPWVWAAGTVLVAGLPRPRWCGGPAGAVTA